jgi:hypothetical protein
MAKVTPKETPTPISIFAPGERPELGVNASAGFVKLLPYHVSSIQLPTGRRVNAFHCFMNCYS